MRGQQYIKKKGGLSLPPQEGVVVAVMWYSVLKCWRRIILKGKNP
jgi:hypothetical protein